MAPELINLNLPHDLTPALLHTTTLSTKKEEGEEGDVKKVDIYSFGIILWCLYTKTYPYLTFMSKYSTQLLLRQVKNGFRPELPQTIPTEMRTLINQCWDDNINNRPDIDEVLTFLRKKFLTNNAAS